MIQIDHYVFPNQGVDGGFDALVLGIPDILIEVCLFILHDLIDKIHFESGDLIAYPVSKGTANTDLIICQIFWFEIWITFRI